MGGVDEQNIESAHPQFNQLLRKFGNARGGHRQRKVFNEFVFSHSTWMTNTIDEMLKGTNRGKYKKNKKQRTGQENSLQRPSNLDALVKAAELHASANTDEQNEWKAGGADLEAEVGGVGGGDDVGRMQSEGREEEGGEAGVDAPALTDLEKEINGSSGFHGCGGLDTHVSVCSICNQRLLSFAMCVHRHEVHEVHEQVEGEAGRG